MSSVGVSMLLDTNVWLDAYIPGRPGHPSASELLLCATRQGHTLLYPARIMADVFYVVCQEAKEWFRAQTGGLTQAQAQACRDHAWSFVECMHEVATAVGLDESDVWLAMKYRALDADLEDDFVLAAMRRSNADYLVTSDARLIRKANAKAMSPADMLAALQAHIA